MKVIDPSLVNGDPVRLMKTDGRHLAGFGEPRTTPAEGDFSQVLMGALNDTNALQQESTALAQSFITDPDSVDVHDVTIAMAKANMAVQITKQVLDGAIKAYKEIINVR